MEALKNHLPTITTLQTNSNGKDEQNGRKPNAVYLAAVIRIITKAISLANSPTISDQEMKSRAMDWADALFGVVPEDMLGHAFHLAIRDHTSAFPVSAYEVKESYLRIAAEIKRREQAEMAKRMEAAERASPDFNVCGDCNGSGFREVHPVDAWGKSYPGVVRCLCCDYWDRRRTQKSAEGHYKESKW